jgi:hypothetical protein
MHTANRVTRPLPTIGPRSLDYPLLAIPNKLGYTVSKECSLACSSQLESSRLRYRIGEVISMRLIFGDVEKNIKRAAE